MRNPRAQRDGDLSQGDITSKLEVTGPALRLWWLYQGFPHQTALPCPVGTWGTRDWEAGVTKIFEVNSVQYRGCVCSLRLSVLSFGDRVRNRPPGRLSWLQRSKIRSEIKLSIGRSHPPLPCSISSHSCGYSPHAPLSGLSPGLALGAGTSDALAQKLLVQLVHDDIVFQWLNFSSFWTHSSTLFIFVPNLTPMSRAKFNAEIKLPWQGVISFTCTSMNWNLGKLHSHI